MPYIQTLESSTEYSKFVLEPLERGFGQTIGNALRRVMLSSIYGAAPVAVKIDKVLHEFAPIPGAKEDTTEFLLNLKDLSIKMDFEDTPPEEVVLKIDVNGPGRVTGADVVCPEGIEIVNPECYLATLSNKSSSLNAEVYVGFGTGYVLPERQEKYKGMIGIIPTGSQFTPVRKVNYIVEQTRVGMRTDYERLVIEVWTNGAVGPNDAVTQAAHILDKYFKMFFDLGRAGIMMETEEEEALPAELAHIPETKIEEMEFSQRTFNCLRRAGILNLRQLAVANEAELNSIRGFGKKSLNEVRDKLAEYDIELKSAKGSFVGVDLLDDDMGDEDF
ncbi:MAG TPA: DNA-directed RNA polymerase subunit alpha [Fimbriimonadaceae bacterium]|nr:DNA-directed RNA polymerase subunit alpha [Fimbriimonadaceae bacterium]